jgi:hypothetical protein
VRRRSGGGIAALDRNMIGVDRCCCRNKDRFNRDLFHLAILTVNQSFRFLSFLLFLFLALRFLDYNTSSSLHDRDNRQEKNKKDLEIVG